MSEEMQCIVGQLCMSSKLTLHTLIILANLVYIRAFLGYTKYHAV